MVAVTQIGVKYSVITRTHSCLYFSVLFQVIGMVRGLFLYNLSNFKTRGR